MYTQTEVQTLITEAIQNMIDEDCVMCPKKDLLDTSERNITAHLRDHIAKTEPASAGIKYQVDHEYNRMGKGNDPKSMPKSIGGGTPKRIIPDICVHFRGVKSDQDQQANLLVMEVKRVNNFSGELSEIRDKKIIGALERDLRKLKALKDPNGRFRYRHAVSLIFSKVENKWAAWISNSSFDGYSTIWPEEITASHNEPNALITTDR
jgi:hypothetical protein